MKLSNFFLSIVATAAISAAAAASFLVLPKHPTTVSYIPMGDAVNGGGLVIDLPANPTSRQAQLLTLAFETAKADGHRYPQLLQGILMQETRAGEMSSYKVAGGEFGLPTNKRYYGVAQIKLSAARDVLKKFPYMWKSFEFHTRTDEEIIAKLIENDTFNIAVASKYLIILERSGYSTPHQLAIAYNRGPTGARSEGKVTDYSKGVMRHVKNVEQQFASNL